MASLNTLQPENVAHGADITVQAQVGGGLASFVTLAEVYEMDLDEDQGVVKLPVLGSRRTGARRGRYSVTGSLKAYWVNQAVASMVIGYGNVLTTGSASVVYHSAVAFQRFNIVIQGLSTSPAPLTIINVVFEKDAWKFSENTFTDQTISFQAEDILAD